MSQTNHSAFKLKGRLYTLTVLQLLTHDWQDFALQLEQVISQAPRLFEKTALVLDCSAIVESSIDLSQFCNVIKQKNLIPVAIQTQEPALIVQASSLGLAVLNASGTHDKTITEKSSDHEIFKNKLQVTPVRSGQQIFAKTGDLIVTATVSAGAELLAEGNIHVYGALRGRALAGISGNKKARIFCQSLEAELISIAGTYRLSDTIENLNRPCQIYLESDYLHIEAL